MSPVFSVHGLRLESDINLPTPIAGGPPDFVVRIGPPGVVADEAPPGTVLAQLREGSLKYTVTRGAAGLHLRLPGTCEFVEAPRGVLTVRLDPSADPGLIAILLCANVPAVLHTAAGECVLHASAVAFDDGAIALVGGSGAGKSTISALLCASGGRLVTEDVLRVRFEAGRPWCLPGVPEIRLRPQSSALAGLFPAHTSATAADGRTTLRLAPTREAPLVAMVLPVASRDTKVVSVEPLAPAAALIELSRYPRVLGWQTRDVRAARFRTVAELARTTSVLRIRVPWGPPFAPDLAASLRSAAGLKAS